MPVTSGQACCCALCPELTALSAFNEAFADWPETECALCRPPRSPTNAPEKTWDAVIIGSGMGGLACAASFSRTGHRVLVLEQHGVAGGQTQVFERNGFTWDVGVHYLGEVAPGGPARHILDWLSEGTIEFASMGAVYDTVHFPGGFEFRFSRPEAALRLDLVEAFPNAMPQIDAFFEAMHAAVHAGTGALPAASDAGVVEAPSRSLA